MRALLWFITAIAVALLIAVTLAYPAYQLIHPIEAVWRLDKIATRLFDVALLGCIFFVLKRLDLRGAAAWGWQVPAATGRRQFACGVALGFLSMLPVSWAMVCLGVRPLLETLDGAVLRSAVLAGVGSGLVVGLLEETLFRGLIQGAVTRQGSQRAVGVVAVAVLFASLHFLANTRIPHDAVTPWSGLELLRGTFSAFAQPSQMIDAFLALFGVGLLTGMAREWTGNILFAAGLHAGWVFVMRATIGVTRLATESPNAWMLSQHDGYTGWLVAFFIVIFGFAAVRWQGRIRRWLDA